MSAALKEFTLRLNPELDADKLARQYRKDHFIRIENLFPLDTAEAIHQILRTATPWHLAYADENGKHIYHRPEDWQALGQEKHREIFRQVAERARSGFSYMYQSYPMVDNYIDGLDKDWPLHAMTEFVNSDEFREFVKKITGEKTVIKLDAQAALYAPGHFLNTHNDMGDHAERRAAYVMGFSKNWHMDWGGLFLFVHENGSVEKGVMPSFNTLTLFKVPRQHIVTQVASFAGEPRLTIVGWLRDDPK